MRFVQGVGDRVGKSGGDLDLVNGGRELVEDLVFLHVHLRHALVSMHTSAIGAAVVVIRRAVGLRLGRVGDLATALLTRERERPLREDTVALQFPIERALAERLAQSSPFVSSENRFVLSLVRYVAPRELAFEAVMRFRKRRVEVLFQMFFDGRSVVRPNELCRNDPLGEASLVNPLETQAAEMEFHLSTHETATLFGWSAHRAPSSFWPTMFVERRDLFIKRRRPTRVPTLVATFDHPVDRLAPSIAIVLLRMRDVHVEHEKVGVGTVAMQDASIAGDVKDDPPVADHLLEDLGIREISSDAIVDVENEMQNFLAPRFRNRGVKLLTHFRELRTLLKGLRLHEDEPGLFYVFALLAFLRIERHTVLLLSIANATDDHRPIVSIVPPERLASIDTTFGGSHFLFPSFVTPLLQDAEYLDNLAEVILGQLTSVSQRDNVCLVRGVSTDRRPFECSRFPGPMNVAAAGASRKVALQVGCVSRRIPLQECLEGSRRDGRTRSKDAQIRAENSLPIS